ncbi:MAG: tetratricopeptide repeat protein [Acetobacter sp.]|nr:tetratricopeptide repeat protein [Acetobacter sp.]MBO6084899.1 tetratricopeptide repeat protein [Acetobacter sp.]MBQ5479447.1 tetratricopeptide repeat protein [Acetobacter sp.]
MGLYNFPLIVATMLSVAMGVLPTAVFVESAFGESSLGLFSTKQRDQQRQTQSQPMKAVVSRDRSIDSGAFLCGIVAARLGDDTEATKAFLKALRADPNNNVLLKQAFLHSVMANDSHADALALRLARSGGGQSVVSAFVLGNAAVMSAKWSDALHYYQIAGAHDALAKIIVPLLQAWCKEGKGEVTPAISGLLKHSFSVFTPFYVLHAGLIAHVGGLDGRAGDLFARAQKIMSGYDLLLTRSYAAWLWNHGQKDKARDVLRELIAENFMFALAGPDLQSVIGRYPVVSVREGIARVYVLADLILRQQKYDQVDLERFGKDKTLVLQQYNEVARLMLGFALKMEPELTIARLMLAKVQEEEGHNIAARETLIHIDPTDPLAPIATLRLAMLDITMNKTAEAVSLLQGLNRQFPHQAIVLRTLGSAYSQKKDWKAAVGAYTRAIDLVTKQNKRDWTLLFLRGMSYYEVGNWPRARADARVALRYAPDEPLLLNFLGYSMAERHENLKEAERLLRKAHTLAPQDAAITDSLGWVLVERGDIKMGMSMLEKAAEEVPEDPEVNYHLGEAYWQDGRHIEAVNQWNMALDMHPSKEDTKLIYAALRRAGDFVSKTNESKHKWKHGK